MSDQIPGTGSSVVRLHPLVGQRVVWRGMEAGVITAARDRSAGGPLVNVHLDAGDWVTDITEGEWEALPNASDQRPPT